MSEAKVMLDNLPEGIMKSDIEKALKEWVPTIKIVSIDLLNRPRTAIKRGKFAFVALSTEDECLQVLQHFEDNFSLDQGFPIEDGFGNFRLGVVKKFVPKPLYEANLQKIDDDTTSWLSGIDFLPPFPKQQQQQSSQVSKVMLQEVPIDTTKSEIEYLIKTMTREISIINIDLARPKKRNTLNAYITLINQDECDSFIDNFERNFADGYWFINDLGCNGKVSAKHYKGKKNNIQTNKNITNSTSASKNRMTLPPKKNFSMLEFHLILKNLPQETAPEEICSILKKWSGDLCIVDVCRRDRYWFVKLESWSHCDTILKHYSEHFEPHGGYAFQNEKGFFGFVQIVRNEKYFLFTGGIDQGEKVHENDVWSINPLSISHRAGENSSSINHRLASEKQPGILPYPSSSLISQSSINMNQSVSSSKGSSKHLGKNSSCLDDNVINELNCLLEEQQTFLKFKTKTVAFIKELEETIKEKCPEFFMQESELVSLQREIDELESKKNEMTLLKEKSLVEYKELEEQFQFLKLFED